MKRHLQYYDLIQWEQAPDEAHIKALFNAPESVSLVWLGFLKINRPNVIAFFLQMRHVGSGQVPPYIEELLEKNKAG